MLKKFALLLTLFVVALSCKKNKSHSKIEQSLNTNDLIHETSPYLLQHAYNPVDWKAWNDDALSLAKKENKLVVISIVTRHATGVMLWKKKVLKMIA